MEKEAINGKAPFSDAIKVGNTVFISGQLPKSTKTGDWADNIADQTTQCLKNIQNILEKVGGKVSDIVRSTIYFTDITEYANMNRAYVSFFNENGVEKDFPARSCIQVGPLMYPDWHVEIDCIAII
jgi:2-iminobutanoate/2-iminopropanoate deaminase